MPDKREVAILQEELRNTQAELDEYAIGYLKMVDYNYATSELTEKARDRVDGYDNLPLEEQRELEKAKDFLLKKQGLDHACANCLSQARVCSEKFEKEEKVGG